MVLPLTVFGLNVCVGDGRKLVIGYDSKTSDLFIDRTNCSDYTNNANFNKTFSKVLHAPVTPENGLLKLHLFVDQSSIELFTNQGKVLTALTYPGETQTGIQVFSNNGNTTIVSFKGWKLKSIWSSDPSDNDSE
ncbi:MAG: GH32 C-terminal domain-containing protein [Segetibacter sp.]